jgi:hypothetical protein
LASGTLIIPGEDPAEFEQLTAALLGEHRPASETENLLVHEMARSWWLTQRAIRLQNECFTDSGIDEKRLALLLRYQTTHERAFHKALNALIKLKRSRERETVLAERSSAAGFVSQHNVSPAAGIGFVSQNPAAEEPNPPRALAEAA